MSFSACSGMHSAKHDPRMMNGSFNSNKRKHLKHSRHSYMHTNTNTRNTSIDNNNNISCNHQHNNNHHHQQQQNGYFIGLMGFGSNLFNGTKIAKTLFKK